MNKSSNQNIVYSASFTTSAGGLFLREINALYPLLTSSNSDGLLEQEVINNRYLQVNSQRTRSKIIKQIQERLKHTFKGFWDDFENLDDNRKALRLFYLVLKEFPLAYDFHFKVTLSAWKGSSREFDPFAFQMRMDEIGNDHQNVRNWSDKTRRESIAVYKRMLKEAGFLQNDEYVKPLHDLSFFEPFILNKEVWYLEACFLSQTERDRILTN